MDWIDFFKLLNIEKMIKKMKALLFFLPIGLITYWLFQIEYGNYVVADWDSTIVRYVFTRETFFIVSVFCIISIFANFMETTLLPTIMGFGSMDNYYKIDRSIKTMDRITKLLIPSSLQEMIKENQIKKWDIYELFSGGGVMIILWLIAFFHSYWVIIPVFFVITVYRFQGMLLTTYYKKIEPQEKSPDTIEA